MKTFFISALFLWGTMACWSQQSQSSRMQRISVVDGLTSNNVYCIKQDKKGYIWFGTESGLSRYDGYRFVNFTQLSPDRNEATDRRVGEIFFLQGGKILKAITSTKDTVIYNVETNRFEAYRKFAHHKQTATNRGATIIRMKGYQFISGHQGTLDVVLPSGQRRPLLKIAHPQSNRNNYFFITADAKGLFYIATYGLGLYVYNPKSQSLQHYSAFDKDPIISSNMLNCITMDRQGNIWVGSEAVGACCIRPQSMVKAWYVMPNPNSHDGLSNAVRCISPVDDYRYFIGVKSGQNYYYDVRTNKLTPAFVYDDAIYSYLKDSRGKEWLGDRKTGVYDIVEDKQGRIWKATFGKGVLVIDERGGKSVKALSFLTANYNMACVRDLELAPDGRLWISTNAGLFSVDTHERQLSAKSFRQEKIDGILTNDEVDFVHVSPKGNLWIGILGKGLVKATFKNGKLKMLLNIDANKGLAVNNVRSLRELPSGQLWVALEEGVCLVSPNGEVVTPYHFSSDIESNAFSENTAAINKGNFVLFGSRNGMLVIQGGNPLQPHLPTRVTVTDLVVNGTSQFLEGKQVGDHITLSHNQNSIVFNYTDFNYSHSSSRLYQYYLEGADKTWHEATSQNAAVYNNLEPGTYVFHIKKIGAADNQETLFTVTIQQPWYNTWWAWCFYILMVVAISYLLFRNGRERFRLRQQIAMDKKLMDFRINFFTHIAHEFRTPIAIIQNAVDKLKESKDGVIPRQALVSALRGTGRLSRLINQLMDFRRINTGNLHLHVSQGNIISFMQRIYQDFWDMAKQKNLNFVFTPFAKEYGMFFDEKVVETILYNLLSNAVKYTPENGSIQLKVSLNTNRQLQITVANNGPAISPQQLQHLFEPFMHGYVSQGGMGIGLYMAHRMAQLHHGNLTYERKDDMVVFSVVLPIDATCYSQEETSITSKKTIGETNLGSLGEEVKTMLPKPLNSYHIAVVEDDYDMLEQIKGEVSQFFHVDAYMDGLSAVEGITAHNPSLVLCDVMLPGIDGYEVVRQIRANEQLKHLPVVMLTSMDDDTHQIKAYQVGADDYVIKPCNYKVLVTRIAQLIKWSRKSQGTSVVKMEEGADDVSSTVGAKQAVSEEQKILLSIEDKRFMEQVDSIIANHLSDFDFSISTIADQVSIGRTTLFGRIKKITGMSPNKYILKIKMEHAKALLTDTTLSISEVGYKIGVDDSAYFYRLFKNYYGMSPSQYRKQIAQ